MYIPLLVRPHDADDISHRLLFQLVRLKLAEQTHEADPDESFLLETRQEMLWRSLCLRLQHHYAVTEDHAVDLVLRLTNQLLHDAEQVQQLQQQVSLDEALGQC